jgi:hypothetical protein
MPSKPSLRSRPQRPSSRTTSSTRCGPARCRMRYVPVRKSNATRQLIALQVFGTLLWAWLGGKDYDGQGEVKCGRLLKIDEVGEVLQGMFPMLAQVRCFNIPMYTADTKRQQSPSTSKTRTSSISLSRSTSSRSPPWSKN